MKRWVGNVLLLLVGLAVGLACAETAVRILKPQALNILYVRPDGLLSHVPGIDIIQIGPETRTHVKINREGLRDVERPRAKPPGVTRVLVLGDSMIEGLQVELPETMPKQLEQRLQAMLPQRRIDVINAGVSGSSGPYALQYLKEEGLSYAPDVVVVTFTSRNDIEDAAGAFGRRPARLYELKVFLRSHFHLYALLKRALDENDMLRNALAALGLVKSADPTRVRPGTWDVVSEEAYHYDGVVDGKEAVGYQRLFASYNGILSVCRARRIPVLFVLLPSYYQATGRAALLGNPLRVNRIVRNPREPMDRVTAFLTSRHADVLDLFPEARKRGETLYFPVDQHFSVAGNAWAAQETAKVILAKGWLSKPR
jgi:lysophospholipase L1-like esterase